MKKMILWGALALLAGTLCFNPLFASEKILKEVDILNMAKKHPTVQGGWHAASSSDSTAQRAIARKLVDYVLLDAGCSDFNDAEEIEKIIYQQIAAKTARAILIPKGTDTHAVGTASGISREYYKLDFPAPGHMFQIHISGTQRVLYVLEESMNPYAMRFEGRALDDLTRSAAGLSPAIP
ncbi:MAG: hypothetical protein HGA67_00740 [Candidatus Yonathbacteria bacterium]|nr:hypothetical protein [Candidatus Yonathbacteria bacterium]